MLAGMDLPEAQIEVAKYLQTGEVWERDLERAYQILCSYDLPEFNLMRAKALFYGFSIRQKHPWANVL